MTEVNKVKDCKEELNDNMIYCECKSEKDFGWPTLSMYVGDNKSKFWLYLHGSDYLIKHENRPYY